MRHCNYCQRECNSPAGVAVHQKHCKQNPDYVKKVVVGHKFTEEQLLKMSKAAIGRAHTPETKQRLSALARKHGLGGHTSKVKLNYAMADGTIVYLQSSYEVAFATLLDAQGISWARPKSFNWIDDAGAPHRYYPDFKIGDIYIDTKNDFLAVKDARKIELVKTQNNIDLRIVTKKDINENYIARLAQG